MNKNQLKEIPNALGIGAVITLLSPAEWLKRRAQIKILKAEIDALTARDIQELFKSASRFPMVFEPIEDADGTTAYVLGDAKETPSQADANALLFTVALNSFASLLLSARITAGDCRADPSSREAAKDALRLVHGTHEKKPEVGI